jgi:hypothetical protein
VIYCLFPVDLATGLSYLRLSCYLAPAAPALFILLARQQAAEIRYEDEWASLDIAE